jgi:membrane protein YqaA with SNARE-associated domain
VLLFPEGTRSKDGSIGEFRCGVGLLARRGATVVPVGLAGTQAILPKGRKTPCRAPVAVVFGHPRKFDPNTSPEDIARALRSDVCALAAQAEHSLVPPIPSFHQRIARFARSRTALWLVFCWSIAEALWWPIIPDFLVAPLALAAPSRWLVLAGVATAGSVLGGAVAFPLGSLGDWLAESAPLLTQRMHEQAAAWMNDSGVAGLLQQPLSGVPYKVFALRAAEAGLSLPGFIVMSVAVRGLRIGVVAAIFAGGGLALQRVWPRIFGAFLIAYCIVFAFGLSATVESWR